MKTTRNFKDLIEFINHPSKKETVRPIYELAHILTRLTGKTRRKKNIWYLVPEVDLTSAWAGFRTRDGEFQLSISKSFDITLYEIITKKGYDTYQKIPIDNQTELILLLIKFGFIKVD